MKKTYALSLLLVCAPAFVAAMEQEKPQNETSLQPLDLHNITPAAPDSQQLTPRTSILLGFSTQTLMRACLLATRPLAQNAIKLHQGKMTEGGIQSALHVYTILEKLHLELLPEKDVLSQKSQKTWSPIETISNVPKKLELIKLLNKTQKERIITSDLDSLLKSLENH